MVTPIQAEVTTESRETEGTDTSIFTYKRIEFHLARKTQDAIGKRSGIRLETLNPDLGRKRLSSEVVGVDSHPANKRLSEGSDIVDSWLDPELRFGTSANRIRKIGAGLQNLGNTCYLNSVLQCLTYTEPLAAYLQSGKHQSSCRVAGFCALCAIQKHVSRALESSGRSLVPKDLVSNLRCISRNFRNARQEDAHEYMINLLESMHKCCLPSGIPIESPVAYEKSLVHKIFGGQLRSQVECQQCFYRSDKFDPFLDVSLEINRADSLVSALQNFTAPEMLDGGEKHYQCQRCKDKVKAKKRLTIHKVPYVLTIHLKRFHTHDTGRKVDKKVVFAPSLDLKPFSSFSTEGGLKYSLYGVLVHFGHNTHSGHYVCFVRTSSGIWYLLNDNEVRPVSEQTVLGQKAYMLFYVRDRNGIISLKKSIDFVNKCSTGNTKERPTLSWSKKTHLRMSNVLPKANQENGFSKQPSNAFADLMTSVKSIDTDSENKENTMNGLNSTDLTKQISAVSSESPPQGTENKISDNDVRNEETKAVSRLKKKRARFCPVGLRLRDSLPFLGALKKKKSRKSGKISRLSTSLKCDNVAVDDPGQAGTVRESISPKCTTDRFPESRNHKRKSPTKDSANECSTSKMQSAKIISGGLQETAVARWDKVESSQCLLPKTSIGYIPDQWDEDYDKGKRKKMKQRVPKSDARNPFQEAASRRAQLNASKFKYSKQFLRLQSY